MLLLSLVLACAPEMSLPTAALAPPGPALEVSPLVAGRGLVVELPGLTPGEPAWLVRGTPGVGPCPAQLRGACLDLRRPAVLGTATADGTGRAIFRVRAPLTLPAGASVSLQGAAAGLTSQVHVATVTTDPLAALSTSFDDPAEVDDWLVLSDVDGTPALHDTFDVDTTVQGALTLDPNGYVAPGLADGGQGPGWYQDRKGPMVYHEITGDFVVRAHVRVGTTASMTDVPSGTFNAGGFVLRDPSSSDPLRQPDVGDERWMMFNIGMQAWSSASELKTTFPDGPDAGAESGSSIFLTHTPALSAWLVACRAGDRFSFWRRVDGQPDWEEVTAQGQDLYNNQVPLVGPDFMTEGFERPDLPETLQVGLIAGRWSDGAGAPVRVAFDEVWFGSGGCLSGAVAP